MHLDLPSKAVEAYLGNKLKRYTQIFGIQTVYTKRDELELKDPCPCYAQ